MLINQIVAINYRIIIYIAVIIIISIWYVKLIAL